jgi:glycosyltransferase involved in cell wall biosynthesis
LIRQANQGVSAARNRGVAEAKGDLIAFLDADDAWKPRFLEVIMNLQEQFPQAGAYATAYEIKTPEGVWQKPQFKVLPEGVQQGLVPNYIKAAIASFFGFQHPVHSSAVAVPKKVLLEIGGFPLGEVICEDLDTWLRIALRYPIAWSAEVLSEYHKEAANRTWGVKLIDHEPRICQTIRRAMQETLSPEDKKDLWEYGARFQVLTAGYCLWQGKRQQALKLLDYSKSTEVSAKLWRRYRLLALLPASIPWIYWNIRQLIKKSETVKSIVRKIK